MSLFSITVSGESLNELSTNLERTSKRLLGVQYNETAAIVAADPAAPAAPKQARTRTRPAEAAPAPVAAPAPAASVEDLKKEVVKKLVTLINANDAVGNNGKQVCTDICMSFGGRNASAIDPAKYPAVIKAVNDALTALSEDPTA